MRSVVESGEVIVKKTRDAEANKLQILEADFIDTSMDNGKIVQGVEFGPDGKRSKYYLFSEHPGDGGTLKSQPYDANSVFHVYKEDRPGQVRGISWFHNVLNILEDLKEFQRATLIKQKISACLTVFVSKPNAQLGLTNDQKTAKRDGEWALEPASIYYLDDGESVSFSQPPSVSGYGEFCEHTLRTVASGLGVTYEQLTGDYSKVNFSSGRMGNLEMRRQVESWRWDMLIPQFCEPAFKHFLEWAIIVYGVSPEGVEVGWVTPAWTMIDPEKELRASILAIRNGLTTTPNVIREQGYNPSQIVEEQREWNKIIDANELILDSDPRKQSSAGQAQSIQSGDNNAKKGNKDAAKASNSGEDNA
jgi:lambda family phage portal protein